MHCQGWRRRPRALLCALIAAALALAAPAAARAAIAVDDVSVSEGNGGASVTFTLTRSAGTLAPARTVSFATVDGSARSPADFQAVSGTRSFPGAFLFPETQVQRVSVPIAGDRLDEPGESFRLVVSGAEVTDGDGTATIVDDDPPPVVSVSDAAPATEGGSAVFGVGLSAPSGRDVSVAFATANATAAAGQDYTARTGTVTIPAGSTGATVPVALLDDSADEPDETFEVRLSAPVAATLGDGVATGTILDNDAPPPAPAAAPAPAPATQPPPATPAPLPLTGSTRPSPLLTRLGLSLGRPRLRQPGTGVVTISCPRAAGRCSGRITLFSRPSRHSRIRELRSERRLGRRSFTLSGGLTQTLAFGLGRRDRALLERSGRIDVRAYAVTHDGAGHSSVQTADGVLLRRTEHSGPSAR
ncbi:MAG: hypothetical protein QOE11_2384 [Solirubrobacteraceae bacterium]|jgi:hypothetical protein|nr:hypothetical protein [Solirubrobacteraceae bacterium]